MRAMRAIHNKQGQKNNRYSLVAKEEAEAAMELEAQVKGKGKAENVTDESESEEEEEETKIEEDLYWQSQLVGCPST